jgi:Protein of unknown function (DUF3224)
MNDTFQTKLKIASWDERPYRELADGSKFSRADVLLTDGTDGITDGGFEALLYYRPDGTSSYVTLISLTANLDGRSGTFVLHGEGSYDGATARMTASVIDGSQTGDLAGLSATIESVSTHSDYPFMPLTVSYTLG